jgi:hypothetical protein
VSLGGIYCHPGDGGRKGRRQEESVTTGNVSRHRRNRTHLDEFAFPIAEEVQEHLLGIQWEQLAIDYDL